MCGPAIPPMQLTSAKVNLPDEGLNKNGYYTANTASLNGAQIDLKKYTPASELKSGGTTNVFEIGLINNVAEVGLAQVASAENDLYGPPPVDLDLPPTWSLRMDKGEVSMAWKDDNPDKTTINVYRNGKSVKTGVNGADNKWTDSNTTSDQALCYSLERQYTEGLKNVSQRTSPACYWGEDKDNDTFGDRLKLVPADKGNLEKRGEGSQTQRRFDHGRDSWSDWGVPGDELTFEIDAPATGDYDILLRYGNGFGGNTGGGNSIETGVTAAVKKVDVATGTSLIATSVLVMPQRTNWNDWGESTPIHVGLTGGTKYKLKISDYYNMSYLSTNADLNGDGGKEILNRANISGITLRRQSDTITPALPNK